MLNILKNYIVNIVTYHFLPERMKINKLEKLACNIRNKENYVIHKVSLKQALNLGLILKRVHKVIELEQEAWLYYDEHRITYASKK